MKRALPTIVAVAAALLGLVNLVAVVELEEYDALRSPDAWLPLTASLAGWLVSRLSPRNVVGWLLLGMAVSSAVFGAAALVVLAEPDVSALVAGTAAWLSAWVFLPSYYLAFLLVPLLYPDGRLPSRQWRPVLVVSCAVVVVESALLAFGSRETIDEDVLNPLRVPGVDRVLELVEPVVWVSMPLLALLGIAALVQRIVFRRGPERSATVLLAGAALLGIVVLLVTGMGLVLGLLLPLVIAAAVAHTLHQQLALQLGVARTQAEELRASRARLAEAHDSARRRIERDLHDGAQQGLIALSIGLGRLGGHSENGIRADAEDLQRLAQQTLVDLRRLASGTYPSSLRELGVAAALREATGPEVRIDDRVTGRPHEETEAALYFACLEAVTNARKHAEASDITVTLEHTADGGYRFTVRDDGVGMRGTTNGTGLQGMADRLGARGGTLAVESAPGAGTSVVGTAYDAPR